jgi:hypothetical protein
MSGEPAASNYATQYSSTQYHISKDSTLTAMIALNLTPNNAFPCCFRYLHWIFSPGTKQGPVMLTMVPPNMLPLSGANTNGRFAPAGIEMGRVKQLALQWLSGGGAAPVFLSLQVCMEVIC